MLKKKFLKIVFTVCSTVFQTGLWCSINTPCQAAELVAPDLQIKSLVKRCCSASMVKRWPSYIGSMLDRSEADYSKLISKHRGQDPDKSPALYEAYAFLSEEMPNVLTPSQLDRILGSKLFLELLQETNAQGIRLIGLPPLWSAALKANPRYSALSPHDQTSWFNALARVGQLKDDFSREIAMELADPEGVSYAYGPSDSLIDVFEQRAMGYAKDLAKLDPGALQSAHLNQLLLIFKTGSAEELRYKEGADKPEKHRSRFYDPAGALKGLECLADRFGHMEAKRILMFVYSDGALNLGMSGFDMGLRERLSIKTDIRRAFKYAYQYIFQGVMGSNDYTDAENVAKDIFAQRDRFQLDEAQIRSLIGKAYADSRARYPLLFSKEECQKRVDQEMAWLKGKN